MPACPKCGGRVTKRGPDKRYACKRHGYVPREEKFCRAGHPNPYPQPEAPHVDVLLEVLDCSHNQWLVDCNGEGVWLADCIVKGVEDLGGMIGRFTIPEVIARERGFI